MRQRGRLWATAVLALSSCMTPGATNDDDGLTRARERMVENDLRGDGIRDERVLAAMNKVPRHEFVPENLRDAAYENRPLPIGDGQTISQPYVVALMSARLDLAPGAKILEIGTGSGYQAAVLAELGCEVYSIEILPQLAASADQRLRRLGYKVHVRAGDGFFGWPEAAPFEAVIITAASPQLPDRLVSQLRKGGRIILPLGTDEGQTLVIGTKTDTGVDLGTLGGVAFVPMTGEVRK